MSPGAPDQYNGGMTPRHLGCIFNFKSIWQVNQIALLPGVIEFLALQEHR